MSVGVSVSAGLLALVVVMGQPDGDRQRPVGGVVAVTQVPQEGSLKVGDAAPDFALSDKEGKATVRLSSFQGKRPVVLIFGSYT